MPNLLEFYKAIFDIQYKLLHFAQPSSTCLREVGQNYGSVECVRCNKVYETQKHWLFSYSSSQNTFMYLLFLLEYTDITQVIDGMVEECLLYHLLEYEKEAPLLLLLLLRLHLMLTFPNFSSHLMSTIQ